MSMTIKVDHLQRGQPASYAPHTYESHITIEGERAWDRLTDSQMRDLVKAVVHHFTDDPDTGWNTHYLPRLKRLEKLSSERLSEHPLGPVREVWAARVETPYTD